MRIALLTTVALAAGSTGCIKQMLLNGQIASTRQASGAFEGVGDFEVARQAAAASLVQFEGMHRLAPDNDDALFMLTRGWTGYGFAFIEDEMERAEDLGDRDLASDQRARGVRAYERGIEYGSELLERMAPGFKEAQKDDAALAKYLVDHFQTKEDVEPLFWTGAAWLFRANLLKDDAEAVANVFVAVRILERCTAIDPSYNRYAGVIQLASYHARTSLAELDEAKKLFDEAAAATERKALLVLVTYATKYACVRADTALYKSLLEEALTSEVDDPSLRLMNMLARRKAKRWLDPKRMFDACSLEVSEESTP